MMKAFGSDEKGRKAGEIACRAIGALAAVGQIDTMITNFLVPLQVYYLFILYKTMTI